MPDRGTTTTVMYLQKTEIVGMTVEMFRWPVTEAEPTPIDAYPIP
jgi:hypothetical protein